MCAQDGNGALAASVRHRRRPQNVVRSTSSLWPRAPPAFTPPPPPQKKKRNTEIFFSSSQFYVDVPELAATANGGLVPPRPAQSRATRHGSRRRLQAVARCGGGQGLAAVSRTAPVFALHGR